MLGLCYGSVRPSVISFGLRKMKTRVSFCSVSDQTADTYSPGTVHAWHRFRGQKVKGQGIRRAFVVLLLLLLSFSQRRHDSCSAATTTQSTAAAAAAAACAISKQTSTVITRVSAVSGACSAAGRHHYVLTANSQLSVSTAPPRRPEHINGRYVSK